MDVFVSKDKNYEDEYSENKFWKKVKKVAKKAGKEIIGETFKLLYVILEKKVPIRAKAIAIAALGYFISPVDAIPDIAPLIGYVDDLGVITLAIAQLKKHISSTIEKKAEDKTNELFG